MTLTFMTSPPFYLLLKDYYKDTTYLQATRVYFTLTKKAEDKSESSENEVESDGNEAYDEGQDERENMINPGQEQPDMEELYKEAMLDRELGYDQEEVYTVYRLNLFSTLKF
jgi:hypothetical protein